MSKSTEKQELKLDDSLLTALAGLDKSFGKGAVIKGDEIIKLDRLSTGSLGLDIATGGGWPKGRVIELIGPESVGKTTLTIETMVQAQAEGGQVLFIDAEHGFDKIYAGNLGLDMSKVLISQPDNGEMALETVERLISTGKIAICVVDSIAALTPKAEIEGEMGDSKMGLHARLMSQAMRKLTGIVAKTNTVLIFTNQLREKIGVMFGNPETTTGGNAMKFYASVRVDLRRAAQLKTGDEVTGIKVKAKTIKNKVASPFQICEYDIMFGKGISKVGEIVDLGVLVGAITKSGSWFSYGTTKIGQGRESVIELLTDNHELALEIETKIREFYGI
jgi:recombination protein RecA